MMAPVPGWWVPVPLWELWPRVSQGRRRRCSLRSHSALEHVLPQVQARALRQGSSVLQAAAQLHAHHTQLQVSGKSCIPVGKTGGTNSPEGGSATTPVQSTLSGRAGAAALCTPLHMKSESARASKQEVLTLAELNSREAGA